MTASHRVRSRRNLTLTISFRIFMLSVAVFAIVIGWVLFLVINANASLNSYVKNAHAQRIINQADTQKQIRQLACLVVKPFPDSSGALIKDLRVKYHCPPFNTKNAFIPPSTTTPKPSRSTVHAAGQPKIGKTTTSRTVVVAVGHPTITTRTRTVHVPQPNPTPTPHPTKPTTSAVPQPRPTVILHLGESTCAVGVLSVCVIGG